MSGGQSGDGSGSEGKEVKRNTLKVCTVIIVVGYTAMQWMTSHRSVTASILLIWIAGGFALWTYRTRTS
jgi:hypothetical protein